MTALILSRPAPLPALGDPALAISWRYAPRHARRRSWRHALRNAALLALALFDAATVLDILGGEAGHA